MSAFHKWFVAQFVERNVLKHDDTELTGIVLRGDGAREELRRRREWDDRYTAALYAWNVKDCDK